MGEVSTIGLDIAKSVFQVHGVDGTGAVVMRKRIGRSKVLEFFGSLSPCLVGSRSLPIGTLLEPRAAGARPHSEADATELCEGLCQA
jgi:transposase